MSTKNEDTRDVEPRRRPSYHAVPHVHRDSPRQREIDRLRLKASSTWTDKVGRAPEQEDA